MATGNYKIIRLTRTPTPAFICKNTSDMIALSTILCMSKYQSGQWHASRYYVEVIRYWPSNGSFGTHYGKDVLR